MGPEERRRAGRAVEARMADMGCTVAQLARKAGVDPKTLRGLISGRTWPTLRTRQAITKALDWKPGEITRRAAMPVVLSPRVPSGSGLDAYTTPQLLDELRRRWDTYAAQFGEETGT